MELDIDWLNSLMATIQDPVIGKLQDNVHNSNPLLVKIKDKSKVIVLDGGLKVRIPLLLAENTTTDSYSGYDKIDTTPQGGIQSGEIRKAKYATSIAICGDDETACTGEAQVVNLLEGKIMQAEESHKQRLNKDLYLDGTGNSSKNIIGLLAMIPSLATANVAYADVLHEFWNAMYKAGKLNALASLLRTTYYALSDQNDSPDIVLTNDLGCDCYEALNLAGSSGASVNYADTKLADLGFANLSYKGIPIVNDKAAPSYSSTLPIYQMLNSTYLAFKHTYSGVGKFQVPIDQDAKVALLKSECVFATNNRRRQGKSVCTAAS